jgi:hypothetical protein
MALQPGFQQVGVAPRVGAQRRQPLDLRHLRARDLGLNGDGSIVHNATEASAWREIVLGPPDRVDAIVGPLR